MRTKLPTYIAAIFLLLYCVFGYHRAAVYGVNWDDDVQRINGLNNWEFITGHNKQLLKESTDKYHGPAVEILLIAVEKISNLTDYHDIFVVRHQVVFLIFVIGAFVFYLLCRMLFDSPWLGLTGMLMLVFSPRIFGEAFYNPKDIPLLAAMVFAFFSLFIFCRKPTFLRALFHAFTCAFAIDIRVIAIVFIPITLIVIIVNSYQHKIEIKGLWKKLAVFMLVEFGLMLLMWPILTIAPFFHLLNAYQQLSNYSLFQGYNRYLGSNVFAADSPWHYHWVWMLISLPEVYILLFLTGVFILLKNILKRGSLNVSKTVFLLLSLFLFLFPPVFRSIKGSLVLDGWRHIYFIYPFMIILAVFAIEQLNTVKNKVLRSMAWVLPAIGIIDSGIQIVEMHPFEYVYFNHTAICLFKPIDRKFEMDYWGVSYKQGYEYILSHRKNNEKIKVSYPNTPGDLNYRFLAPKLKEIFIESDRDKADYFLTNYRSFDYYPICETPCDSVYLIRAQGNVVMGVYKLK